MASARLNEDSGKTCPVCFEKFIKPKKLPACGHTLCENCIHLHLSSVKHEQESELEDFQCPICRSSNHIPKDHELLAWVQSLEDDLEVLCGDRIQEITEDNSSVWCTPCKVYEIEAVAEVKCLNCSENLCQKCCRIRHSVELFRDHITVNISDKTGNNKLENELLTKYLVCQLHHGKLLSFVCEDEDTVCCWECILLKHRSCSKVVEIKGIATKESNDKGTEELKDKIARVTAYSKQIIASKKENEIENKHEKDTILASIQEMRRKVNDVFDVLQETITEQCNALTKKNNLVALDDIEILQGINKELSVSDSLVTKLGQHESENLRFVLLRNLKTAVKHHETGVLEMGHACKKYGFELGTQDILNSIVELGPNDSDKLATVVETEHSTILPEYTERLLLRNCAVKQKLSHKVVLKNSSSDWPPIYSSIAFLPNNHVFLVDSAYGFCCLLKEDFTMLSSCNLDQKKESRKPHCVTHVKDDIVAISVPRQNKIVFVEANANLNVKGELVTKYQPKALQRLRNGEYAVSWNRPVAFGVIALSNCYSVEEKVHFDRDAEGRILMSFDYMVVDEDRSHVLQSCNSTNAVYCFDLLGNPKFVYRHTDDWWPEGIALDSDGNIYVCDRANSMIHVLSPQGSPLRIVEDGCPNNPVIIGFHLGGMQFVVTSGERLGRKYVSLYEFK